MTLTKEFIEACIEKAEQGKPTSLPIIGGFSSSKVRRLLNHLCRRPGATYLEIGVHHGSTFIPALYRHPNVPATCIDLWVQHPVIKINSRKIFENNLREYLGKDREINIIEADLFTVDLSLISYKVNTYFFDGPHDYEAQRQAFVHFDPVFTDCFIAVVDDYNWQEVREGTQAGIKEMKYHVVYERTLPGDFNGSEREWWNGLYVAILEKSVKLK